MPEQITIHISAPESVTGGESTMDVFKLGDKILALLEMVLDFGTTRYRLYLLCSDSHQSASKEEAHGV